MGHDIQDELVIQVKDLTKIYRTNRCSVTALNGIDFDVYEGDIFGFIGPNGAGKTTTIKILTGIMKPTSGLVKVAGYDVEKNPLEVKKRIGAIPEELGFYKDMTGREILEYHSKFYDGRAYKEDIDELALRTGIDGFLDRCVVEYSYGMKKRLALAQALINNPNLLILDEPTLGLDPKATHFLLNLIRELNQEGITIFMSSHILSAVQSLCSRVGVIDKGRILKVDSIEELSDQLFDQKERTNLVIEGTGFRTGLLEEVKGIDGVEGVKRTNVGIEVILSSEKLIYEINRRVFKSGASVKTITADRPDLEEIFLNIIEGDGDG